MKPVIGIGLLGASVVVIWGGISGRLAPMIAALFYPGWLKPNGSDSGGGITLPTPGGSINIHPPRGFTINPGDIITGLLP